MTKIQFSILAIAFLYFNLALGQEKRESLAESEIFVNGVYKNEKNTYNYIAIREFLKDTLISNKSFKKFELSKFKDYSKEKNREIYYESFANDEYEKRDQELVVIHKLNVNTQAQQNGILFRKKGRIELEFVDTRRSSPRNALEPDATTPRKFYFKKKPNLNISLRIDLQVLELEINRKKYTKHLLSDIYTNLSKGIKNREPVESNLTLKVGDEIQVFYQRKWYNKTTKLAEYEDKQYKNIKYVGDTIVDGQIALNFRFDGFNYLSGKEDSGYFPVLKSGSGYYYGNQLIDYKQFKPELKIIEQDSKNNYIYFQAHIIDRIGTQDFPRVIQYNSLSRYCYYILPYFPTPYVEAGNVVGKITYVKKNNQEFGVKKVRIEKTDSPNIRKIVVLSNNTIELTYYLTNDSEVHWFFYNISGTEPTPIITNQGTRGQNTIVLKTPNLKNREYYQIQMEVLTESGKSITTHGFKARIE
jgi:hypothetical protein